MTYQEQLNALDAVIKHCKDVKDGTESGVNVSLFLEAFIAIRDHVEKGIFSY